MYKKKCQTNVVNFIDSIKDQIIGSMMYNGDISEFLGAIDDPLYYIMDNFENNLIKELRDKLIIRQNTKKDLKIGLEVFYTSKTKIFNDIIDTIIDIAKFNQDIQSYNEADHEKRIDLLYKTELDAIDRDIKKFTRQRNTPDDNETPENREKRIETAIENHEKKIEERDIVEMRIKSEKKNLPEKKKSDIENLKDRINNFVNFLIEYNETSEIGVKTESQKKLLDQEKENDDLIQNVLENSPTLESLYMIPTMDKPIEMISTFLKEFKAEDSSNANPPVKGKNSFYSMVKDNFDHSKINAFFKPNKQTAAEEQTLLTEKSLRSWNNYNRNAIIGDNDETGSVTSDITYNSSAGAKKNTSKKSKPKKKGVKQTKTKPRK